MNPNSRLHWTLLTLAKRVADGEESCTSRELFEAYPMVFQSPTDASAACATLFEAGYTSRPTTWTGSNGYVYELTPKGIDALYEHGAPDSLREEGVPEGFDATLPARDEVSGGSEGSATDETHTRSAGQPDRSEPTVEDGGLYVQTPARTRPGSKRHAYRERGRLFERVCNVRSPPGRTARTTDVHDISRESYGRLSNRCSFCCSSLGIETTRSRAPAERVNVDVESLVAAAEDEQTRERSNGQAWPSVPSESSSAVTEGYSVSDSSGEETWYTSDDPADNKLYQLTDEGKMEPATISLEPDWLWLGVQLSKLNLWAWAARAFEKKMTKSEAFTAEDIVYQAAWDSSVDLDFGSPVDEGVSLTLVPTPVSVDDVPEKFRESTAVVEATA